MKIERIVNTVAQEVSSAFSDDAFLVQKLRKALRREFRVVALPKRQLIARLERAQGRNKRADFRLRVMERALNLGVTQLAGAGLDHAELSRALRMSARLSQRAK